MRCPKGYRQKPPKSGNCVKNTTTRKNKSKSKSKSKSNSNKSKSKSSSRKNRTVASMSSSSYSPKFYDVAEDIFPEYKQNGYVSDKYRSNKNDMIQKFVNKKTNKSKFRPGDILFVGSVFDSRQYDNGFVIVGNDYETFGNTEGAIDLPHRHRNKLPAGLHYEEMVQQMIDKFENSDDEYDRQLALDYFNAVEANIMKSLMMQRDFIENMICFSY